MQEFAVARWDEEDRRNCILGPGPDLECIEQPELRDFELKPESAAQIAAKFCPVQVPRNSFLRQHRVFATMRRAALADPRQSPVAARDNLVRAAAFPRTRNKISDRLGPRTEEQAGERFKVRVRLEMPAPHRRQRRPAGDTFQRRPKFCRKWLDYCAVGHNFNL